MLRQNQPFRPFVSSRCSAFVTSQTNQRSGSVQLTEMHDDLPGGVFVNRNMWDVQFGVGIKMAMGLERKQNASTAAELHL